jgi:uncharacterized repeat protein (TIGR03803 family)
MTHRPFAHAHREALGVPRFVFALLLVGLGALSGCGDGSSNSSTSSAAPTLQSLVVSPTTPSAATGTYVQLTATGIYSDYTHADLTSQVTWTSSNTAIATITAGTGKALGVLAGTATLSASLQGRTATTSLTVSAASLVSIALTPPVPSLAAGTSQQFTAVGTFSDNTTQDLTPDITWSSSDLAIATVSSGGLGNALSAGRVTISAICKLATTCGTIMASTTLIVTPATLVSIAVTPPAPTIALGTSTTLTATGTYSDHSTQSLTSQVTWNSANPAVATLSNATGTAGAATPIAPGATIITASMGGLTSPQVLMTVTPATLVSIAVTPSASSMALGVSVMLTATGTYTDHSTQNVTSSVTWTSANPAVATVSNAAGSAGLATPVAVGPTTMMAMLGGVTSPAATFTVTPATLVSIAITPTGPSIAVHATEQFIATGTYTDQSTQLLTNSVTWASSAANIASISNATGSRGLATGLLDGTTSISALLGAVSSPPVTLTITLQPLTVLYSFHANPDVQSPSVGLIQATDGNFYGTSPSGGANNNGAVFMVTPAGVETVLYSFAGGNDGFQPMGALVLGTDGNLYGTTNNGGASGGSGTIFQITTAGVLTTLHTFFGGSDGVYPNSALIQGADGNFYGVTSGGGTHGDGIVFAMTPAGTETVLYSFAGGNDGRYPAAGLLQGVDGNFYGTTSHGGSSLEYGTVFKITPAGQETVLHAFTGVNDGNEPHSSLIQTADGTFYGTTMYGGLSNDGVVFEITPAGVETTLYAFTGLPTDGYFPGAALVQGTNGNFYGTTLYGGTANFGVVFELTPAGVETVLHMFENGTDGSGPQAPLIQATDGNFYGTTSSGGTVNLGTVFKF